MPLDAGEFCFGSDETLSSNVSVDCSHPQVLPVECKLRILGEIQGLHADWRGKYADLEFETFFSKKQERIEKGERRRPQRRGNRLRWLLRAKSQPPPCQSNFFVDVMAFE